ncbi:MAG: hypothetical protein N2689_15850, partial [Verrucomicrobiae bacterium]|nr:hypothetical protein [Verrucomicrobiae bacterium]
PLSRESRRPARQKHLPAENGAKRKSGAADSRNFPPFSVCIWEVSDSSLSIKPRITRREFVTRLGLGSGVVLAVPGLVRAAAVSSATLALFSASIAFGDQPSPLARLVFQHSLQAGVRDPNGKLIAGTEIMHLVPQKGRLYASTSLWTEKDPSIPKACQVLVLDSPKGQWRVERQFTTNNLRYGSLRQVSFATDHPGRAGCQKRPGGNLLPRGRDWGVVGLGAGDG